jgi:GMP synthase (glutamine-hydrolysing)
VFWGTQYHPEYDLNELATVVTRYGERLVGAGFFADLAAARRYVSDLRQVHADATRRDLIWQYGLSEDVIDGTRRRLELRNWLVHQVGVSI